MPTAAGPPPPPSTRLPPLEPARRLVWLGVSVGALAMLVVGAMLRADVHGHGTHTQLGLYPCPWILSTGHPCPTCGWTTAVTYAAHGDLIASLDAQPFAMLLAVAAAVAVWVGGYIALTGSRIGSLLSGLARPRMLWAIAGLVLAAWIFKLIVTPPGIG